MNATGRASNIAGTPKDMLLKGCTAQLMWWYLQVALGAGLVAITVWGVQRIVVPYAAQWYRSWSGKPDKSAAVEDQSQIATVRPGSWTNCST